MNFPMQSYSNYLSYFWANDNVTREYLGIKKVNLWFLHFSRDEYTLVCSLHTKCMKLSSNSIHANISGKRG